MADATIESVFEDAFLSNVAGYSSRQVSGLVTVDRNTVVLIAVVKNLSGTGAKLSLLPEGSHDGQVWVTTDFTAMDISSSIETMSQTSVTIDYAFVRVRATFTTTSGTGSVVFSSQLALTQQS